jgi:hypothetical protein
MGARCQKSADKHRRRARARREDAQLGATRTAPRPPPKRKPQSLGGAVLASPPDTQAASPSASSARPVLPMSITPKCRTIGPAAQTEAPLTGRQLASAAPKARRASRFDACRPLLEA